MKDEREREPAADRGEPSADRGAPRSLVRRAREWVLRADEQALPRPTRWLLIAARVLGVAIRELSRGALHVRAAALSFHTLVAIVPALALAFAVGEAAGLYDLFVETFLRPFLDETLGAAGAEASVGVRGLRETVEAILSLVEHTSLSGLGIAGLVVLLFALARVVRAAEEAFSMIFEVRGPRRSLRRRVRAFLVTLAVTPLGLAYAVTAASAGRWLEDLAFLGPLRELLLFVLPPILATLALLVMYRELPPTEVRASSALVGALVGGVGWYGLQLLHVHFQVGLARWNAIYSGFGAFPVLLANIQASWLIVLLGALVTAGVEHAALRALAPSASRSHTSFQRLAIRVSVALAALDEPARAHEIAERVKADVPSTRRVLERLAAHGLVSVSPLGQQRLYVLVADPARLRAFDVIDAIERDADASSSVGASPRDRRDPRDPHDPRDEVALVLDAGREAATASAENLTIEELGRRLRADESVDERARG